MIAWRSSTKLLGTRNMSFCQPLRVLIILNELPRKNQDVMAILDRCDSIEFQPTKDEVIGLMRLAWPSDTAIIDRFENLPIEPSLRLMAKAKRWDKSSTLSLDEELLSEAGTPLHIQKLVQIMLNEPREQWRQLYEQDTGKSERSYRRDRLVAEKLLPPNSSKSSGASAIPPSR